MVRVSVCMVIPGLTCLVGLGCQNETQDNEKQSVHLLKSDPPDGATISSGTTVFLTIRLFFNGPRTRSPFLATMPRLSITWQRGKAISQTYLYVTEKPLYQSLG